MRERAAAVAVAKRPDARYVRAALIVNLDVSTPVPFNRYPVKPEVIRVGDPADREKQVRTYNLRFPLKAVNPDNDPSAVFRALGADAVGVQTDLDAFVLQDL